MVAMGPGIPAGARLSHLGTNVDLAPTFLELAGVVPPPYMDGRSVVPFLIPDARHPAVRGTAVGARLRQRRRQGAKEDSVGDKEDTDQGGEQEGGGGGEGGSSSSSSSSNINSISILSDSSPVAFRNESFFQYYNAGPWSPDNGGDICPLCIAAKCSVPGEICPGLDCNISALTTGDCTVRKLDSESNTYIGITTHPDAAIGYWKLAEFQNACSTAQLDPAAPSCFDNLTTTELFDLKNDPHELTNVAASAPAAVVRELRTRLRAFYPCKGRDCP